MPPTARLLAFVLCALPLAGCATQPIPTNDGATTPGDAAVPRDGAPATDAANQGSDLGASHCAGLDQATCRVTAGCYAANCLGCSCVPGYAGCLAVGAPGPECPAPDCAQQAICCRAPGDCPNGAGECVLPGASPGGGACIVPPRCKTDGDCANNGANSICAAVTSPCLPPNTLGCQPGCAQNADCPTGDTCNPNHHCLPTPCGEDLSCPSDFTCANDNGATSCQRQPCTKDADCGADYCVEGLCYPALGTCEAPVP